MPLSEALARAVLQVLLLAVLLVVLIRRERSGNGLLWLYFPFFLGMPAVLLSLFVLAPLEAWIVRRTGSDLGLLAVPFAAALAPTAALAVTSLRNRRLPNLKQGVGFITLTAFAWGLLWIATHPLHRWLFA